MSSKGSNMIVVTGLPSTTRATEIKALFKKYAKVYKNKTNTTTSYATTCIWRR